MKAIKNKSGKILAVNEECEIFIEEHGLNNGEYETEITSDEYDNYSHGYIY